MTFFQPHPSNLAVSNGDAAQRLKSAANVLSGGGEMGELMRSIDWATTPLGPVKSWSQALRTMVGLVLRNKFPIVVWWGPRYVQFYNDAFGPILGDKHPSAMGQPGPECWAEIWDVVGPMAEQPMTGGDATWNDDLVVLMNRKGFPEETHFKLAYSPIPDEMAEGTGIGGVIATVAETTSQIYAERQLRTLRDLGARAPESKIPRQACDAAAQVLGANAWDVPFALIYMVDEGGREATLTSSAGFGEVLAHDRRAPRSIALHATASDGWPWAQVVATRQPVVVDDLVQRFGAFPTGKWATSPHSATVLPLGAIDQARPYGLLVVGLSPHRALDDGYRAFVDLVATQIVTALRDAFAYQEERARAEELAKLDRAKTTFFSNISHEFRTPLTLMLGPLEELQRSQASRTVHDQVERVHRNAIRLLKLVNSLLDFARLESGRMEARFAPVDFSKLVANLSSAFRSAIEKAGLRLDMDCPTLSEVVYVDSDLFEKVVLNLLSNALKFTFSGAITVRTRIQDRHALLIVEDTGVGIPAHDQARVFERFHRVEGHQGRSIEGTGIGLALVRDVVGMHGGSVVLTSTMNVGSIFTITMPLGTDHLRSSQVAGPTMPPAGMTRAQAFVAEASQWQPGQASVRTGMETLAPGSSPAGTAASPTAEALPRPADALPRPRILLVDDNADMRDFVEELLALHYEVETAANGEQALLAARAHPPALVLTDVMMPVLDGFGLLRAIRDDERLRAVPVIMLSARAGEEARVEGLQSSADDYLVKPFTARELLARVASTLRLYQLRELVAKAEHETVVQAGHASELERALAAYAQANAELQQFAYVASHDLKEPLRMVTQYMGLLDRKLGPDLSDQNRQYLHFAVDGALRMQSLITDLLSLTNMGGPQEIHVPVDLTSVLQEVVTSVSERITRSQAELTVAVLPTVLGSHAKLVLLFENLLGNALKFHAPDQVPRIGITHVHEPGWQVITVSDQGIGIDPSFHRKIFEVFQRLHTRDEYPGTGIGLAICRKIVDQHHGEIWVESQLGGGSRFVIRLPDSDLPTAAGPLGSAALLRR